MVLIPVTASAVSLRVCMTRHPCLGINGIVPRVDGVAPEDYLFDLRGYIVHYTEIFVHLFI